MTSQLIREYQSLLLAEETPANVDRAIALVEKTIGGRIEWSGAELALTYFAGTKSAEKHVVDGLNKSLHSMEWEEPRRHATPRDRTPDKNKHEKRIITAGIAIGILPGVVQRDPAFAEFSRFSFFMDCCHLVFHHVCFGLIPSLSGSGWARDKEYFFDAASRFSDSLVRSADKFGVLAIIHDERGECETAAHYYMEAIRATHADDHEFLSVVQSGWTYLIEQRQYSKALDLLLDIYPRVSRVDLDEVAKLISLTFQMQSGEKRPG